MMTHSSYPETRVKKDSDGVNMGVTGSVSLLQNASLSGQPISSFDWSPDKVSLHLTPDHPRGGTLVTQVLNSTECIMTQFVWLLDTFYSI